MRDLEKSSFPISEGLGEQVIPLAGCVVTNEQDEILLLHRNTRHRSQWETPGGKIGGSEPVAAAARRRAEEEIGAILRLTRVVGSCQFSSDGLHYSYLWFHAHVRCGAVEVVNPRKHDNWRFFSWNALSKIRDGLSGNVTQLYNQYNSGKVRLPTFADCQPTREASPALTVPLVAGCLIQDTQGRALLLHRNRSGRDQWETPGGKVELGESPERCAAREALEELGIVVDIGSCLGMRALDHRGRQILYVWYAARIVSGSPRILEDRLYDICAYRSWADLARAPASSLSASVQALLAARNEALTHIRRSAEPWL